MKLTIICSMGAIRTADQPAGTNWVNGYPHTAWMDMNLYYIQAFKSGACPAVTVSDIRRLRSIRTDTLAERCHLLLGEAAPRWCHRIL